jgi:hypothetical protein
MPRIVVAAMLAVNLAACATLGGGGDGGMRTLHAEMRRCGVDTRGGGFAYSPQDALLTLSSPQASGVVDTTCLARLLIDNGIEFKAGDLSLAQRYADALEREYAVLGVRKARYWLKRNRKGKVPDFVPAEESLSTYVRKLERICDAPAGSVGTGASEVLVPWLEGEANNQVSCVYLAALASNLAAIGVKVVSLPDRLPAANE